MATIGGGNEQNVTVVQDLMTAEVALATTDVGLQVVLDRQGSTGLPGPTGPTGPAGPTGVVLLEAGQTAADVPSGTPIGTVIYRKA